MGKAQSDAPVFFGATGDLASKKTFPALQAVPVIGVAKAGWNLDDFANGLGVRARLMGAR